VNCLRWALFQGYRVDTDRKGKAKNLYLSDLLYAVIVSVVGMWASRRLVQALWVTWRVILRASYPQHRWLIIP